MARPARSSSSLLFLAAAALLATRGGRRILAPCRGLAVWPGGGGGGVGVGGGGGGGGSARRRGATAGDAAAAAFGRRGAGGFARGGGPRDGGSGSPKSGKAQPRAKGTRSGAESEVSPGRLDLTPAAKDLLARHDGNVDAASSDYYQSQLRKLEKELRELSGGDGSGGGDSSGYSRRDEPPLSGAASERSGAAVDRHHRLRLRAAWDAVALFLPVDYARSNGRVDGYVTRRLSMVAAGCFAAPADGGGGARGAGPAEGSGGWSILDVGCGDGAILPYLDRLCRRDPRSRRPSPCYEYLGIDVSPEMIALGRRRRPGADLAVGCFPDDVPGLLSARAAAAEEEEERRSPDSMASDGDDGGGRFDCVLFNGSLQFFGDVERALSEARRLLRPRPGSRIVVAHALGSKFVDQERRASPGVALSRLPDAPTELRRIARGLGMRLALKRELVEGRLEARSEGPGGASGTSSSAFGADLVLQESDESDSNFYLAALVM
jgi:SAM-dependent methyltransferase